MTQLFSAPYLSSQIQLFKFFNWELQIPIDSTYLLAEGFGAGCWKFGRPVGIENPVDFWHLINAAAVSGSDWSYLPFVALIPASVIHFWKAWNFGLFWKPPLPPKVGTAILQALKAFCIVVGSKLPLRCPLFAPGLNEGLGELLGRGVKVGTLNPFFCKQLFWDGVKFANAPPKPRLPWPFSWPWFPAFAPGLLIEFGRAFDVALAFGVGFVVGEKAGIQQN